MKKKREGVGVRERGRERQTDRQTDREERHYRYCCCFVNTVFDNLTTASRTTSRSYADMATE